MFDHTKITGSLYGIVGFRQPLNTDYAVIDADNLISRSGYIINDNPYAKPEFLYDNMDFVSAVPAVADNPLTTGVDESAPAKATTDFNVLLKNLQKSAISDICSRVFNQADYIDRNLMFVNAMNKVNLETMPTGFVGYRLRIANDKNVAVKITRCLLDFSGTGSITLLLFNTASKTALQTKAVTITSDHQEVVLNWVIDNQSTTYKGEYYIGYVSNELAVTPYKRDYENSVVASKISMIDYYSVRVLNHTAASLFDLTKIEGDANTWGLNFDITVYEDFTNQIINNEHLFARAIYLQSVINCIRNYSTSLRSNRNQRISNELINRAIIEIEGQNAEGTLRIVGLRSELTKELASVAKEVQKLKDGYFSNGITMTTLN